jgi:hypothetical protein
VAENRIGLASQRSVPGVPIAPISLSAYACHRPDVGSADLKVEAERADDGGRGTGSDV